MKKNIFLYSGEGTRNNDSHFKLIQHSPLWSTIKDILSTRLNIDLEKVWTEEKNIHACPHSPILTVVNQICLSDLWSRWGYCPDVVIGHSIGELTAAYQAGFYSLEEILTLTHAIGKITARLSGVLAHGKCSDDSIKDISIPISSYNFRSQSKTHITVSSYKDEMEAFLKAHHGFRKMKLPHPWHHPDYHRFLDQLPPLLSKKAGNISFISGITSHIETQLKEDHWQKWMVTPVNFIDSIETLNKEHGDAQLQIIEMGFHPALDRCCTIFKDYTYISSMFRGEDEINWILNQRKKLDPAPFSGQLKRAVEDFQSPLDFNTSLAYQGFTSLTFTEFSHHLNHFFPSLAPQDFFRYKSIQQLIDGFGVEKKIDSSPRFHTNKNEVVVAGMSCRFPADVENLKDFWKMLRSGEDQVTANENRSPFEAGFLNDEISRFDHKYFNISDAEAQTLDPQQILALELTEMLFRDAAINIYELNPKRVGVYIGAWNQEYGGDRSSVYYPTGTNPSLIAARISYHYDLRGPSFVSNTACSSSLIAMHYAAKDIEAGRVDYAIVGGVNMLLNEQFSATMKNAGFLSKDHRCKTFDNNANGYVRAEGGGLVLLVNKKLTSRYYAAISGSAVNQNGGRSQVITAPHPEAQEELIADACEDAGINPSDIAYVECHGTGTKLGDPIEISALQKTVARGKDQTLDLGSVKSNMGHLESAAGIAGVIKSVLMLNYGIIPSNLHFKEPNEHIDFKEYGLNVVSKEKSIEKNAYIGISSFGFGGSNAHVIVKGAKETKRKEVVDVISPFDRKRAPSLHGYLQKSFAPTPPQDQMEDSSPKEKDVKQRVQHLFHKLTGIESIDPDIELTDQGLDSMSATELIHSLEQTFHMEIDPDILFEYPLIDQFVGEIERKLIDVRAVSNA